METTYLFLAILFAVTFILAIGLIALGVLVTFKLKQLFEALSVCNQIQDKIDKLSADVNRLSNVKKVSEDSRWDSLKDAFKPQSRAMNERS